MASSVMFGVPSRNGHFCAVEVHKQGHFCAVKVHKRRHFCAIKVHEQRHFCAAEVHKHPCSGSRLCILLDTPVGWGSPLLIMVVPPASAALVPWAKPSAELMPGVSPCSRVWASMPPGITSCPWASMLLVPSGTSRFSPICLQRKPTAPLSWQL